MKGAQEVPIESQVMRKLLIALLVLLVIVAAAALILLKKKNAVLDSGEVERIAARLLPGASPPAGLQGVVAFTLDDLQVAILAPGLPQAKAENLGAGQLRIIIASPQSDQPPQPGEILEKISQVRKEKSEAMETLSKNPVALTIGGKPYPAQESKLKVREGGKLLREDFTILLVDKHPVVLMLSGNEENYPAAARDEFLGRLTPPSGPPHPQLPDLASKLPAVKPPGLPVGKPPGLPVGKPPGLPVGKLPGPPAGKLPQPPALARPSIPKPSVPRPRVPRPRPPGPGMPEGPPGSGGPPGPPGF